MSEICWRPQATKTVTQLEAERFQKQIMSIIDSKGSSLVGAGPITLVQSGKPSKVCVNARAAVADKQAGANPLYPGPGQYVDPIKEGRAHDGTVKVILSTQRGTTCTKFVGPSTDLTKGNTRSMAKPNAENEPGPGAYINPMKFGRGADGQACAVTSLEKGYRSTVWCKKGAPRSNNFSGGGATPGPGQYVDPMKLPYSRPTGGGVKFGRPRSATVLDRKPQFVAISRRQYEEPTPGPGQYVDPMKEGRNAEGEAKALLSTQHNMASVKFCGPSGVSAASGAGLRSLAKPNAEREPGPGQYNGSDRNKDGQPILSKGKNPASCVFARKASEPSGAANKNRPASAPVRRKDLGSGYFKLDGDEKILSKYRNQNQAARWGPPGR